MSAEAMIKAQARGILKHNFVKAIAAMLIALLPLYMIDGATTALSCAVMKLISDKGFADILIYSIGYPVELVAGFLLSPVINGYIRAFYRASYTQVIDMKDVFFYFEKGRYGEALRLNIRYILRMLLPALLLYSPLIIYEIIAANAVKGDFYGSMIYNDFFFILAVLSTVTVTLYSLRYFTVFTISADNPQLPPEQIFAYSKHIMRNMTGSAAKLIFSFTPWLLLGLTVLPLLYVIPYMTQSLCVGAKWMTKAALESDPA